VLGPAGRIDKRGDRENDAHNCVCRAAAV
jgi:hypothetical protein